MSSNAPDAAAAHLRPDLLAGVQALGLSLSDHQIDQLLAYLALIAKWNRVYNLTAVRDAREMLTHHLLDSLAVIGPLRRQCGHLATPRLLDVGSGAGLPGVVIAICCPGIDVSCVDTVAKKAAFIQQAAGALQLPNLHGIHARVENLSGPFDVISSRAFASLADFAAWSAGALAPGGVWMAMKGKHPADEIAALPVPGAQGGAGKGAAIDVFHVEQLTVPGLNAERCIVWMRPAA